MMKSPRFDIDLDKHYNATVVIACDCGHEVRHHLASLHPDKPLRCHCGADISMPAAALDLAQRRTEALKASYRVH
ncbi:hypothetical protein ACFOKJ_10510 [Vogesella amnigena]|uniref:Uncharacterized protein n=1 Tax=Vogesella amnigena TaxID=1507449 RepID=A0ABV7TUV7_9NEIS